MASAVAAELLRRGDLVRVAVPDNKRLTGPFCLVTGTTHLVDLSPLASGESRPSVAPREATPKPDEEPPTGPGFDRVLVAMEHAQNLSVGEPHSGRREVILLSILNLLQHFLPGLNLFIWLFDEDRGQEEGPLCGPVPGRADPSWLSVRRAGQMALVDSWIDLPLEIQEQLVRRGQRRQNAPGAVTSETFAGAVAVSLLAPRSGFLNGSEGLREEGMLVVVPSVGSDRSALVALARKLSGFVTSRWQRHSEVNQRIHTDSLTGVNNRAFFDSQFLLELERAKRRESPLTLVLADLDRFKRINDTHGHPAGDRVLKGVAQELLNGLRRIDHVCRIGGEEFALVLPDTDLAAAQEVILRLMVRLDRLSVRNPGGPPLSVTLSFGGATYPTGGGDTVELYRKADLMLYRSKETGRHRCHFWNQHGEPLVILPGAQAG